jgi:hypothetical protein
MLLLKRDSKLNIPELILYQSGKKDSATSAARNSRKLSTCEEDSILSIRVATPGDESRPSLTSNRACFQSIAARAADPDGVMVTARRVRIDLDQLARIQFHKRNPASGLYFRLMVRPMSRKKVAVPIHFSAKSSVSMATA